MGERGGRTCRGGGGHRKGVGGDRWCLELGKKKVRELTEKGKGRVKPKRSHKYQDCSGQTKKK